MLPLPDLNALKKNIPGDRELMQIGRQASQMAMFDIAEFCYRTLATRPNTSAEPVQAYLECLVAQYKYDTALRFVNRQLKKSKAMPFYRNWRARLHILTHNMTMAERDLLTLVAENPQSAALQRNLALLYRDFDIRDKAQAAYNKTLALDPDNGEAFRLMMSLEKYQDMPALAAQVEQDLAAGSRKHPDFWFGLGKIYDDLGDTDKAWHCFDSGNQAIQATLKHSFDRYLTDARQMRDGILSFLDAGDDVPSFAGASVPVVLIAGFARSGTTMFENVLAADKMFQTCGELTSSGTAEAALRQRFTEQGQMPALSPDMVATFGGIYAGMTQNLVDKRRIVVDKAVTLFRLAGLFTAGFDTIRILQPKRDPKDVVLSNIKARFLTDQLWSFNIDHILQWLEFALESMNIWQDRFPDQVMTVHYDDYVADPAIHNDKLADFLTIDGRRPVPGFQKRDRAVMTATANQLGDQVHTASRGKAAAYDKYLGKWDREFERLYRLM